VHLVGLVNSAEHVCCRYRLTAFRHFLEAAGHDLELIAWPRSWWQRLRLGRQLRDADAVIVQRRLWPAWQLRLLRGSMKRLILDLDDAVFLRDSYAGRDMHSPRRLHRFAAMVRAADAVVAGNRFLADAAMRLSSTAPVCIIPTCVDPGRYPLAAHQRRGPGVQLVWVGSSSTLQGLEAIRDVLEQVGRDLPGLHFKLICDRFLNLQHLPVLPCRWSEERETAEIAAADIGISWLPDDGWSAGKCGLKVLQYMAAGLPVVANPVGVQKNLVRHGETGFLVETPDEWEDAVRLLAADPELRRHMGQAGRRRVEEEYLVARGVAGWQHVLRSLEPAAMERFSV